MPREIHILGAGLVGSLLAAVLARRGARIRIFEKRPDPRTTQQSAGKSINLALAERGIHPLREAGLWSDIQKLVIPMRGRMVHHRDGRTELVPYGQRPEESIYSISRRDLNCLLLSAAEETGNVAIQFDSLVTAVDLDQQRLTWCDDRSGWSHECPFEFALGADGSASLLRGAIVDRNAGIQSLALLDHAYKELAIPAGPRGHRLPPEALHIWPRGGFMLIALPNLDGSFTVTLFLPHRGDPSFESLADPNRLRTFFQHNFPDALAVMPDLERDFGTHPTGELGTVRCWPWSFRDVALVLGDAAHAIVPFHGQGMNAGFEDCAELLHLLSESGDDWQYVCRELPAIRKPNTDAIAAMALENYLEMRDASGHAGFPLRKALEFELERRFPDRFIPRYSMVMFHRLPYSEAMRRGEIQARLLDAALCHVASLSQVDFASLEADIVRELAPV